MRRLFSQEPQASERKAGNRHISERQVVDIIDSGVMPQGLEPVSRRLLCRMGVAHHSYSRSPPSPSERIDLTCAAPVYTVRRIRSNRTRGSHAYSLNALESACLRHGCACRSCAGGESRGSGIRAGTEARAGVTYPAASV